MINRRSLLKLFGAGACAAPAIGSIALRSAPKLPPLVVKIRCDTSEFQASLEHVKQLLERGVYSVADARKMLGLDTNGKPIA